MNGNTITALVCVSALAVSVIWMIVDDIKDRKRKK